MLIQNRLISAEDRETLQKWVRDIEFELQTILGILTDRESAEKHCTIATRVYEEPSLRRLFYYSSMSDLRFTRSPGYPYDPQPFIHAIETEPRTYELRDADVRPLLEGSLDTVVAAIVPLIRGSE